MSTVSIINVETTLLDSGLEVFDHQDNESDVCRFFQVIWVAQIEFIFVFDDGVDHRFDGFEAGLNINVSVSASWGFLGP
eukprot:CAMPEP_0114590236 /NCGR_PEP_ID=MMETSP0125-20121206/12526_1 /TAXON_ID=485358 ORGANISM="Aristerostoma sp., Strain ATCC 50986" /NCGR_SAMPLE_ID=MMETSP0125 /ASSEMBLY_ACC=CAM_ASM_000245 /LENGTH=78 /DNA_ID=CAMNT_0001787605 /DNA_START=263 /DNA_END=499 /DNA_ORIENTATION=-